MQTPIFSLSKCSVAEQGTVHRPKCLSQIMHLGAGRRRATPQGCCYSRQSPFSLWQPCSTVRGCPPLQQLGVQALQQRQHQELFVGGVVAHVALCIGVLELSVLRCHAEKRQFEQVGLVGEVQSLHFYTQQLGGNEGQAHRLRVYRGGSLGYDALHVPMSSARARFFSRSSITDLEMGFSYRASMAWLVRSGLAGAVPPHA